MPIEIPGSLVEFILLGPADDRRQLQDSPILGDVWIDFGRRPGTPRGLLISPFKTQHAGHVAKIIAAKIDDGGHDPSIAYLQGLVVADLTFRDVLRVIIPKTKWWSDKWIAEKSQSSKPAKKPSPIHVSAKLPNGESQWFVNEIRKKYFDSQTGSSFASKIEKIIASAKTWIAMEERQTLGGAVPPSDRVTIEVLQLTPLDHSRNGPKHERTVHSIEDFFRTERKEAGPVESWVL